jgi:hypothetical protein
MYIKSVNDTVDDYNNFLHDVAGNDLKLKNTDCDTGRDTAPGEYPLTDATYAKLLDEHSKNDFAKLPADLRAIILDFYAHPPTEKMAKEKSWKRAQRELLKLKEPPVSPTRAAGGTR